MTRRTAAAGAVALALVISAGAAVGAPDLDRRSSTGDSAAQRAEAPEPQLPAGDGHVERAQPLPLAGRLVVLDPGHQLGNPRFPGRVNRPVPAGGSRKPCNTSGASTRTGYPEATFAWRVAGRLRANLEALGARVVLTRGSNRADRWGPCVDARGRAGNRAGADLKISIHADGSLAPGARGFHVIAPTDRRGWTDDIYRPSRGLAFTVRAALRRGGFQVANYAAGGDGVDFRGDLATLNLSDVPTVMVELGNMRHPHDARSMTRSAGQTRYAEALRAAIWKYLR